MEEQGFWQDNESYMNLVMNKWNMLADDTYIYVVHLEQKRAWFSETTRTYFGIKDAYVPDHYEVMRRLIHPDDFWEYHMYSIHTDIVADSQNAQGHLIILLHNENVLPRIDALTDLYSHTRFDADIETAIEKQEPFAVLMIKLERFTNLNIIYGTDFTN